MPKNMIEETLGGLICYQIQARVSLTPSAVKVTSPVCASKPNKCYHQL